jgi:ABC-type spermidine/putrescine transport system permease subunit I
VYFVVKTVRMPAFLSNLVIALILCPTFTYTGHKIRAITRILQKAGIQTVFTTKHTLGNFLRWQQGRDDKYDSNGVYQL